MVEIRINGTPHEAPEGTTILACATATGVFTIRPVMHPEQIVRIEQAASRWYMWCIIVRSQCPPAPTMEKLSSPQTPVKLPA